MEDVLGAGDVALRNLIYRMAFTNDRVYNQK